ncbi:MAG: dephospho-CoA kinase [Patescibacteria group bacterium]
MEATMLVVGLTGGIACGKSRVRKHLGEHADTRTFDCDAEAKKILFSADFQPCAEQSLGADAFCAGQLDKDRVSAIIFYDSERRERLAKLLYPLVRSVMNSERQKAEADGIKLFIIESAIIFETGLDRLCDMTVCITCGPTEQLRRLIHSRGMTEDSARARIATQLPERERVNRSDLSMSAECPFGELEVRTNNLHDYLRRVAEVTERNQLT